jgi:leucyl-tRNA---protein transferase
LRLRREITSENMGGVSTGFVRRATARFCFSYLTHLSLKRLSPPRMGLTTLAQPQMLPPEPIFFDATHPCSYLPGRTARLPYRRPLATVSPEQFDQRLAEGDRRSGIFLYRTACPSCRACQPLRLDVAHFKPNATQRRMHRRGEALLDVRIGAPVIDRGRVRLFNLHRDERGLAAGDSPLDERAYADFLTDSCCQTLEFSYWQGGQLIAVAIADQGRESLSAVYCYYDPSFRQLSLGTYSILRHVDFCQATGRRFLYLGFYIAESPHMAYKSRFRPHQRLIDGCWRSFA